MNFYDRPIIVNLNVNQPIVKQIELLSLLGNPSIPAKPIIISGYLLYQFLRIFKLAIEQENTALANKINSVNLKFELFVAIGDDENYYHKQTYSVTDSEWTDEPPNSSAKKLDSDEKRLVKTLVEWLNEGLQDIFPELSTCLGTQLDLLIVLHAPSSKVSELHLSSFNSEVNTISASTCSCRGEKNKHKVGSICKSGCKS